MKRRTFLLESGRAALGAALLTNLGPSQDKPSAGVEPAAIWRTRIAKLERDLPAMMADAKVPGLSAAIIRDGRLFWRRAFGLKDSATKAPVHVDTIFEAASMSKPVFAYAVMKLSERKVIDLDTPLTHYASERLIEGDPRLDLITARHVLSHTSGFQNWRSKAEPLAIHFQPGERFSYSGEGYSYLESVVTHLVGQPFDPFMKANVLVPFQMTSSGYVWNGMFEQQMALPHDRGGKPLPRKRSSAEDVARYGSSGALLTTPTDYARFLIEVIAPKTSDRFRLEPKAREEMLRPAITLEGPRGGAWAMGWSLPPSPKGRLIAHGGDNEGFHSWAVASLDRKCGFVLMTNGESGGEWLLKLITGEVMQPFV
jgi:CubicO group peptidase (beta-lactamase class C family)